MALRVLVADESVTIKKVIQLALQDYGVTVKSVPIGSEVLSAAKTFNPDIIFADVLLGKKNGYELAEEINHDPDLKSIPVILMWSGFIQFDETRFQKCGAKDKLEKPFDADALRQMIQKYVHKAQSNVIASFVTVELPDFVEEKKVEEKNVEANKPAPQAPLVAPQANELKESFESKTGEANIATKGSSPRDHQTAQPQTQSISSAQSLVTPIQLDEATPDWSGARPTQQSPAASPSEPHLSTFYADLEDGPEEFEQIFLGPKKSPSTQQEPSAKRAPHTTTNLTSKPTLSSEPNTPSMMDLDLSQVRVLTTNAEEVSIQDVTSKFKTTQSPSATPRSIVKPIPPGIEPQRLEQLIQAQVREVIKEIAWQIIPDLAERIIREEINRVLKEAEKLP